MVRRGGVWRGRVRWGKVRLGLVWRGEVGQGIEVRHGKAWHGQA